MKRAIIIIRLEVKWTGYRDYVERIGRKLKLTGFVEYLEGSGSYDVKIVIEGDEDVIHKFVNCIGDYGFPPADEINITYEAVTGEFKYFSIHRGDLVQELGGRFALANELLKSNMELIHEHVVPLPKFVREIGEQISTLRQETMKFGDDLGTMRNELVGEIGEQISTLRQERLLIFEKEMLSDMHENFERYDSTLQKTLKNFPYEKSVFIMMPFEENDIRLKTITDTIIKTLKEHGLCGWRADDSERRLMEDIWDNIVVNMLSCKYGIAVFVDKKVLDRYNDEEIIVFNANIALEVGFMKSRGLDILLLKDKRLKKLPTDIISKLYEEFNFDNPEGDVKKAVTKWIERLPVK